ncbi:Putative iron transport protein OS=Streptomyces glaucescens OX=1907 GN=SGLAU_24995 PE=3 SV=1 [Streptomyces glaucescens]
MHYSSATGWHRFGLPYLAGAPHLCPPLDAVTVAALLAREGAGNCHAHRVPSAGTPEPNDLPLDLGPSQGPELVGRVADSVRRVTSFLHERRSVVADTSDLFLAAEQALLLGHPLHPTPKSREGITEAEARPYSPELRGSFPLHWLAVAPSLLATDSAWTERGRPVPAARLTARLAGAGPGAARGARRLPLHPWQFREIRHSPEIASLLDAGLLRDLGTHGAPWHPTSSVRTVYRSEAPAMLKLSLGLRITNSRRETSARNFTEERRCTACSAPGCPSSGVPRTRASTSSAIRPGSPSTDPRAAP